MKFETTFFNSSARILRDETVLDAIRDIANLPNQEDAFCVLDAGDVVQKIKTWKLKMPRVKPFYAVKCNDNETVLDILAALGTGFDCASKNEMKKIIDLGVDSSRIIFAHPCKPASHLRQAATFGVDLMTFDNETELTKVKDIMPRARLVVRIRCDALKAQCPLGVKFGALPEDVYGLLSTARDLGLDVVGVSFHVGSGCQEPQVFSRAIQASRKAFDEALSLGFAPYLLDIGGGFPGTTGSTLNEISEYVNEALQTHFPDDSVQVIAEPGRYMVASAFTMVTQVISKRRVESSVGEAPSFMYYINDGVYGSFNCTLYDHQEVVPTPLKKGGLNEGDASLPLYQCSIWGPTCDSLDQVVSGAHMPEMEFGEWVVWRDMGAYTLAAAGTFNGFPVPLVHVVVPFHTWMSLESAMGAKTLDKPLLGGLCDALPNLVTPLQGLCDTHPNLVTPLQIENPICLKPFEIEDSESILESVNHNFALLNVVRTN